MEKLPGVQLRHLWPSLTMSERLVYLRQLVEWLHTLYAVPRPGGDRGLASLRLDDGEAILTKKGFKLTWPNICVLEDEPFLS